MLPSYALIMGRSAFASALTRGFAIYLEKVKGTTKFSIKSSPQQSTYPRPSSFISVSENVIFYLQGWKLQPTDTGEKMKWYKASADKNLQWRPIMECMGQIWSKGQREGRQILPEDK